MPTGKRHLRLPEAPAYRLGTRPPDLRQQESCWHYLRMGPSIGIPTQQADFLGNPRCRRVTPTSADRLSSPFGLLPGGQSRGLSATKKTGSVSGQRSKKRPNSFTPRRPRIVVGNPCRRRCTSPRGCVGRNSRCRGELGQAGLFIGRISWKGCLRGASRERGWRARSTGARHRDTDDND